MRAYGRNFCGVGLARSALTLLSLAAMVAALPIAWRLHETHALWGGLMLAPIARLEADRVVVLKARRELLLYHDDTVVRRYPVSLGFDPNGHKRREGDGRTPEGRYRLDWRRLSERVGAAIHVSYPNAGDRERAAPRQRRSGRRHHAARTPWQSALVEGRARPARLGPPVASASRQPTCANCGTPSPTAPRSTSGRSFSLCGHLWLAQI